MQADFVAFWRGRVCLCILSPLYTHSVLHALLSRKSIRRHLNSPAARPPPPSSPFDTFGINKSVVELHPLELKKTQSRRSTAYSDRQLIPEMNQIATPEPKNDLTSLRISGLKAAQEGSAAENIVNAWDDPRRFAVGGKVEEKFKLGTSQMFL